ncbi:MAG: hypothetical protein K0A99_07540 [Desulfoarculaceae bacterium]|nr:hypothetical protein [Desulfoarculaceae bacterium]
MNHTSKTTPAPPPDTQQMLDCLKQAVAQALDKKKRLGQYAVFWEDGKPVLIGEDAPQAPSCPESKSLDAD